MKLPTSVFDTAEYCIACLRCLTSSHENTDFLRVEDRHYQKALQKRPSDQCARESSRLLRLVGCHSLKHP